LQISDSTNKQGILEEIDFFCGTDTNSYPTTHKIRNLNNRYREILTWVFEVYGGWQFNDSNQTDDLLYADQTLTSGTSLYAIPATAIIIVGAEVISMAGGTYQKLYPYTQEKIQGSGAISEFQKSGSVPNSYQLIGDSIKVLPPPNYTLANALRAWFWKDIVTFAVTDTAVVPGIPAIFHRALSIGVSLDYAIAQGLSKLNMLQNEWNGPNNPNSQEKRIKKFFVKRMKEIVPVINLGNNSNEFK
jgi:hypothetical protein